MRLENLPDDDVLREVPEDISFIKAVRNILKRHTNIIEKLCSGYAP